MLLAALLIILNNTIPHEVLLTHRLEFAGVPVNILDALLFISVPTTLFGRGRFETRPHPLFTWSVVLTFAMIAIGAVLSILSDTPQSLWLVWTRNWLNVPLGIIVGYRAIKWGRSARAVTRLLVIGSLLSALLALSRLGEVSETMTAATATTFDILRKQTGTAGDCGVIVAAFVAFALVARVPVLARRFEPVRTPLSLAMFGVALAALVSLPHRSYYLLTFIVVSFAVLALPRSGFGRRFRLYLASVGVSAVAAIAGVLVISHATGRDFGTYLLDKRISQMGDMSTLTNTRWTGIVTELSIWSGSPVWGRGFGYGDYRIPEETAYHHNVWTSLLAETGLVGLVGVLVPVIGMIVVGMRMWRDQFEPGLALAGAVGAIYGVYALVLGTFTMSINLQRGALGVGLACGLIVRCRAIELALAAEPPAEDADYAVLEETLTQ